MTEETRAIVPGHDYNDREIMQIIARCENQDRSIQQPTGSAVAKQIRRVVHGIVAERLIEARNRSGINNDRINALMHSLYLERKRDPKAWAFSNAVGKKNTYLPDEEEIDMLSTIIPIDKKLISLHLRIIPWAMDVQRAEHEQRRRKEEARKMTTSRDTPTPHVDRTATPMRPPAQIENAQASAGDLKISHNEKGIHVHGKVWCNRHVAQRLRMIVPLKLIQQAHGDNPWCYEMKGQVHDYQLYNLMHVLYGAPRVLQVELD